MFVKGFVVCIMDVEYAYTSELANYIQFMVDRIFTALFSHPSQSKTGNENNTKKVSLKNQRDAHL